MKFKYLGILRVNVLYFDIYLLTTGKTCVVSLLGVSFTDNPYTDRAHLQVKYFIADSYYMVPVR